MIVYSVCTKVSFFNDRGYWKIIVRNSRKKPEKRALEIFDEQRMFMKKKFKKAPSFIELKKLWKDDKKETERILMSQWESDNYQEKDYALVDD